MARVLDEVRAELGGDQPGAMDLGLVEAGVAGKP